jgi:hypothetical protein
LLVYFLFFILFSPFFLFFLILELVQIYRTVHQDSTLLRKAIHDFDPTVRIKELSHKIAKQIIYAEELKSHVFAKSLDNSNNHAHSYHPF